MNYDWVMTKYQCSFTNGTTVVGVIDNRRGSACVGVGGTQEISVPSFNVAANLKLP